MRRYSRKRTGTLVELLDEHKARFGPDSARTKRALLEEMSGRSIADPDALETYHDALCFLRAYPDDPGVLRAVERELGAFGARVNEYKAVSGDRRARKLLDTGIVNTAVVHTLSYELTAAISALYGESVDIDWRAYNRRGTFPISDFLPLAVTWLENDTLDNDLTLDDFDWLTLARGPGDSTTLSALLKILSRSGLSRTLQRHLFETAQIPIRWTLTDCPASRTLKRVPWKKVFFQREPLAPRTRDLRAELARPASPLTRLKPAEGAAYVRHIREILGVRVRELYPLIHSNPEEVYVNEPGRGVQIVILGNVMDIRLPVESNLGTMVVRNGMPLGYSIGSMLFERAETGINIFPAYRQGESPYVIEQLFRLLHHHLGARVFVVRSYQVGDENEEALESGSFWFYYKLGFRPIRPPVRSLADGEFEKIRANPRHRTPIKMLKRLSRSDMFFHVDPARMGGYDELPVQNLGRIVTRYVADRFDGRRDEAVRRSMQDVARILGIRGWRRWSRNEITGFGWLAPLVATFPDLARWTGEEKTALAQIIRAKGGRYEAEYVRLCNRHARFRKTVEDLAFGRIAPRHVRSPLGF